ncbi:MAG: flagellar hook-basal body complex protein FliE [Planctomycetota bacterium]|jgi:flagellar hook-basal body complex protein FliE
MINLNPNVTRALSGIEQLLPQAGKTDSNKSDFANTIKAVEKYISKVDELQQSSETSIKDLLSGKNEDINSVVAAVAEADSSFKLLVGVRNKLIEAYKQTMNMQI